MATDSEAVEAVIDHWTNPRDATPLHLIVAATISCIAWCNISYKRNENGYGVCVCAIISFMWCSIRRVMQKSMQCIVVIAIIAVATSNQFYSIHDFPVLLAPSSFHFVAFLLASTSISASAVTHIYSWLLFLLHILSLPVRTRLYCAEVNWTELHCRQCCNTLCFSFAPLLFLYYCLHFFRTCIRRFIYVVFVFCISCFMCNFIYFVLLCAHRLFVAPRSIVIVALE